MNSWRTALTLLFALTFFTHVYVHLQISVHRDLKITGKYHRVKRYENLLQTSSRLSLCVNITFLSITFRFLWNYM